MSMNQIIRKKRKEIGLTQEKIAEYLGVSTPAVNKWESGSTYPDITLLPGLARLLNIDLNTLLCFNAGLSEQEIQYFCKEVAETCRKSSFESGFLLASEKIQEYPNCIKLIQSTALILESELLMACMSAGDKETYDGKIMALYERVAKSDDEQLRNRSIYMLAAKYTSRKEYNKAQEMLDLLPESTATDKKQLQANLWIEQGKLTEAADILERKLLTMGMIEIHSILISLARIAVKEGNDQDASHLAEISRETAKLFGLRDYYSFMAPLEVALAKENAEDSIPLLKSMLAAALTPWEMNKSALFRHILMNDNQENTHRSILPGLIFVLENDSKYAFLRSNEEFQQLIEQYRSKQ